jgi:hypothetical protein
MTVDLFAGIPVRDYAAAAGWYERLLGAPPAFLPNDTEAVWELADHRYTNGVRKATFRGPDGNEIGFGGAPA